MASAPAITPIITPTDMQVVERVLGMRTGYVLDFSYRTFDDFIAREASVDATAPRYSVDGGSKAKRLRRILPELPTGQQARLLSAFLAYRDSPARGDAADVLDDEWRRVYEAIVQRLERTVVNADAGFASSSWTGRRTVGEQVAIIRSLAPLASRELEELAALVESRRFNDPVTANALACLRELHRQLGELLATVDRGSISRDAIEAIEANRRKLTRFVGEGAKLGLVAPAMTFGIMHILSWMTGVPVDSTMVSTVFGTVVGTEVLRSVGKQSSLARE